RRKRPFTSRLASTSNWSLPSPTSTNRSTSPSTTAAGSGSPTPSSIRTPPRPVARHAIRSRYSNTSAATDAPAGSRPSHTGPTARAKDRSPVTMQQGNTYRFRPDGSHIEQFTWGQVNPFGLCFDPLGNLYSADCHSQPIYQLLRGAYYPSFEKGHDGLGFGPAMINNYRGSTAIAGIVWYAADHFPAAYQGSAYVGDVVTNRINRFTLKWHGSSPW